MLYHVLTRYLAVLCGLIVFFEHLLDMMHFFDFSIDSVYSHWTTRSKEPRKQSMYVTFDRDHDQSIALRDTMLQVLAV